MVDDESVANFCAITSAEPDLARQYLEVSNNNVEEAISLYFESGGASIESQSAPRAPPPVEEEVRERIAPVTERLVHPGEMMGYMGGAGPATAGPLGVFNQQAPRGAFEHQDDDDIEMNSDEEDDLEERTGSRNLTSHQSRLANLFRPPFDLIKDVDLDQAKTIAQQERKWVMVNVQDNHDFQCQQLNRDLWSDKRIKDCVKQNFVFLQYIQGTNYASNYQTMYPFDKFPHISILDSKTGEQLRVWDIVPEVESFLERLYDFLSQFSLQKGSKNPVVEMPKKPKKIEHMTEDEQIEMAMRESMGLSTSQNVGTKDDPVEIDSDNEMVYETAPAKKQEQPQEQHEEEVEEEGEITDEDRFVLIEPSDEAEPTDPATTTRIQIRYSGGRIIRRFNLSDSVKTIFAVIKHNVEAVQGHYFSLTTPDRKKLIEHLDETVETCNLKNSVIMIEIED